MTPGGARPYRQLTEGRQVEAGAGKEGGGEALAAVFAVAVVGMHAVDQPVRQPGLPHSSAASDTRLLLPPVTRITEVQPRRP